MYKNYIIMSIVVCISFFSLSTIVHAESNYASNVVVVNFHSFFEEGEFPHLNHINVTPKNFEEILLALKTEGYQTIDEDNFYSFLNGKKYLPQKSIVITIDDGYRSVYEHAFPILKKLNMKAIFFPITSDVQKGIRFSAPMVTWDQTKEMVKSGYVTLGNHSHNLHWRAAQKPGLEAILLATDFSNNPLTLSREEYITNDALFAEHLVQKNTGLKMKSYSYPFGAYDDLAEQAIKNLGYTATYATTFGTNLFGQGSYNISRIPTAMSTTAESLISTVNELYYSHDTLSSLKDLTVQSNIYRHQLELQISSSEDIENNSVDTAYFSFAVYKIVDGKRIYSHEAATTKIIPATVDTFHLNELFTDYPSKGDYSMEVVMIKKDRTKERTWIDFTVN